MESANEHYVDLAYAVWLRSDVRTLSPASTHL
jgi:hypothetical protein